MVTNLSQHLKWGRENALVWVTTLDAAQPVRGARVSVHDCRGGVLWTGATERAGRGGASIGRCPVTRLPRLLRRCRRRRARVNRLTTTTNAGQSRPLSALDEGISSSFARTDDDMTFVHSGWNEGIETCRFQVPDDGARPPLVAHTVFDRSLFRVGETVHMKHVLRVQSLQGFSAVSADRLPAQVVDPTRGQ